MTESNNTTQAATSAAPAAAKNGEAPKRKFGSANNFSSDNMGAARTGRGRRGGRRDNRRRERSAEEKMFEEQTISIDRVSRTVKGGRRLRFKALVVVGDRKARVGVGVAKGDNRIIEAVRVAVNSPLLETTIEGARGVILNVVGGTDLTFDEVADAAELVRSVVDASANIIFGARIDPNVQDEVEVTVIATGFPGFETRKEDDQQKSSYGRSFFGGSIGGRMPINNDPYNSQRGSYNQLNRGIGQQSSQGYYNRPQASQPQQSSYTQPVQPQQSQYAQPQQTGYNQPAQPQYSQPAQPQQQYAQPQQTAYSQQPHAQPAQPQYSQPSDDVTIERPSDKSVPKFARMLKNLGRHGND